MVGGWTRCWSRLRRAIPADGMAANQRRDQLVAMKATDETVIHDPALSSVIRALGVGPDALLGQGLGAGVGQAGVADARGLLDALLAEHRAEHRSWMQRFDLQVDDAASAEGRCRGLCG